MPLATISHAADFCVVGGGLAGLCAALAAARHGAQVILMQERPMLGGNASSEIRMWVSGAHGEYYRETGILEELMMENQYRNPDKVYAIWDSVLYEKARVEKNLTLLLNCSCMDAEMEGDRIRAVKGWQMTTQQFRRVEATLFADCSGDSILAPLTGAPFRMGREGRDEYGESIAPPAADQSTMGLSCLLQAEETREPHRFIPPAFAEKITADQLRFREPDLSQPTENFWYLELGGRQNTIADAEEIRDGLQELAYGMWDYLKNDPAQAEKHRNWKLNWVGMLPGKRESRRYVGAHVLTENEVLAGGNFADEVAYGGWTMDDHHPAGFRTQEPPNIFHPAPSPYGIPFGCLYSEAVPNLMFAGRNISVTHAAMSSSRVMGTCALLGQAVGTAAALAIEKGCLPAQIAQIHMGTLQARLQQDDCFLPHCRRPVSAFCLAAQIRTEGAQGEKLLDGVDRPLPGDDHAWVGTCGQSISYIFSHPVRLRSVRLVMDSDLNREHAPAMERQLKRNMFHNRLLGMESSNVPETMLRRYRIEAMLTDGRRITLVDERNNYQRLRVYSVDASAVRELTFTPLETWGSRQVRLFGFEADGEFC